MKPTFLHLVTALAVVILMSACDTSQAPDLSDDSNPLLAEWSGPYGGVPAFDRVEVYHFEPALNAAMEAARAEIDSIANSADEPTFANTIEAYERSGRMLNRVRPVYSIWGSNLTTPEFQAVQREMAPRLAAFSDEVIQNEALFRRIEAVYNSDEMNELTPEQQRLAWRQYTNFVRAGAELEGEAKQRLAEINQELAGHFTEFSQRVLADEEAYTLVLESEEDLAGLPESLRDAAASAAEDRNVDGWVITNTRSSVDPFLTYSDRRDLREQAWRMFVNRGDNNDQNDTKDIITQILKLRAERAELLGYETHAHWRLENTMAQTPENTMELMEAVWPAAIARANTEVDMMQAVADSEGADITIEPWDYHYYMEKVRQAEYDLDQNEVKEYLQLSNLRDAMFWVGGELFDFDFTEVTSNVPVFHEDVRVWEVTERTSGEHAGLFYFDPYARQGKRSGAWMNAYRSQERMDGEDITTIVSNNSNFVKGRPGEPVLISWDDAETLFHEFGHALHGLLSDVTYPSLAGTAVARDFVEFPSQLLEHWLATPEVLQRFALHYESGEPIPEALVERIEAASTFNEGFATTEYLASAFIDMKMHLAGDQEIDPSEFEARTLAELGMPDELVMRHRSPHFLHVFSSDSYSAGYYSYLWSDVLTADAYQAFEEADGPYDPVVAQRLRDHILSVGNTIDQAETYRNFRGRDAEVDALMRKRGFPTDL